MRSQVGGTVNVEVNAAPQQDTSRVLEEMRMQYEGIADKNRREVEAWYKDKVTRSKQQIPLHSLKMTALLQPGYMARWRKQKSCS